MLGQYLLDLLVFQRQRLALIGLLQSLDECLKLQIGSLLAQAFAKARTQAISEIVGVIFRCCFGGPGDRKKHAQR
ncbi:hypothetical protein D3C80_1722700 [compost metagenome]